MILLMVTLTTISCNRIDAGYEGTRVKMYGTDKGVDEITLTTGWTWYNPLSTKIFEFPLYVKNVDYPAFDVNSRDGSVFTVDPTLAIRVKVGSSPQIIQKYRTGLDEIIQSPMFNYVRDAFRIEMNKFNADELISNREAFEQKIQEAINVRLEEDGFILEQLTSGMRYPQSMVNAIDAKNKAVQVAMQAENELRVAEARAKIKLVEAETEARANELRSRTLTPLMVQQMFIEKWDGKTPLYANSPQFFRQLQ